MGRSIRGLFLLEPPAGGLERLRQAIRGDLRQARWHIVMPWAATACLVLLISTSMLIEPIRAHRAADEVVDQIVESTRALGPQPLTALSSDRAEVQVYLAVPASQEDAPE